MTDDEAAREAMRRKALFYGEPTPDEIDRRRRIIARVKALAREIEKKEGARRDLDALEKAGVPRKQLLWLLALTVDGLKGGGGDWAELMRDKRDELKSLAGRMETFAGVVDRALGDPLLKVQLWFYMAAHGVLLGMKLPHPSVWKNAVGASLVPSGLRALAKLFRGEARIFGQFLREFARKDAQTSVALLLLAVFFMRFRQGRVRKPDHLPELARLLTDAIEAAEINKYGSPRARSPEKDNYFTADSLEKVWNRRGKRTLRRWFRLNFPAPQSEKPAHPLAVRPLGFIPLPKVAAPPTG